MVADPARDGRFIKGTNFEEAMRKFILGAAKIRRDWPASDVDVDERSPIQLDDALIPVAVGEFNLRRMRGLNLTRGCMANPLVAATCINRILPSAVTTSSSVGGLSPSASRGGYEGSAKKATTAARGSAKKPLLKEYLARVGAQRDPAL
mmetsp:Transcript_9516/g.23248  ORF Transcript_9516/g.23248 Transcript_9516/m.23248 type:complete len:149 (+) Transcript_9516:568-1014(+)